MMGAQCPRLAIRWGFQLSTWGTQCVWFASHIRRIAVTPAGGYKYVDHSDHVYVQYFVFLFFLQGFLQLLLFTDLVALRSPKGPENHSLAV